MVAAEVVGVCAVLGFRKVGREERRKRGLKEICVDGGAEADLVKLEGGFVSLVVNMKIGLTRRRDGYLEIKLE